MDFTFGTVFYGVHKVAGKEVAIKLEPVVEKQPSPLKHESKIYKTLMGGPGVPWMNWSGKQGDYNVMVIDLLGPSLEDLFKLCNRQFTLKTVLLIADQLLSRIEFIHSHDLVHRDIKPANFVMGTGQASHLVNVIDFGLAKKFRDHDGAHIPYKQDAHHGVGTSLFASINTHLGIEASPRDDLESLSYMLVYFLRGTLPWRKLKAATVAGTWDLISRRQTLRLARNYMLSSPRVYHLHEYARALEFGDTPDYMGLRATLAELSPGVQYPALIDDVGAADQWGVFDWDIGRTGNERRGRVCEACRRRQEASWATTRE
ncbi:kinase-like protein [Russula emetica]|nr:kinase-like protein [Russula emetica]